MSTLSTTNLKNPSASGNNIVLAASGRVTVLSATATIATLTDAATITPDFDAACNFAVTLGGNRTLANPTNIAAGQSGSIFISQDATGSRTLAFGSNWDFISGTAPTPSSPPTIHERVSRLCTGWC
jgi:hypothetical protein